MDDSFGGMSDDEFFLGYDAMIDEDDLDSINYDLRAHSSSNNGRAHYGGGCCYIALISILVLLALFVLCYN